MSEERDQALRDIVKGASVVYMGLILEMGIAFLAQWLAARYLSKAEFGGLTTGLALLNVCAIAASFGLGRGLTRYLPRHQENERRTMVQVVYLLTLPIAIVLAIVISANATTLASNVLGDQSVTPSIRVFGAAVPFATLLFVSLGGIRGKKISIYRVYVENLLRPLLRFGLVIFAVVYGLDQFGFAMAYAIPYAVGGVAATILFLRTVPEVTTSFQFDASLVRDLFRYSTPFIVKRAANFIYRSVDIFIILYLLGSGAVGVYGVAYAAARLMLMFSTAFNFLGSPIASEIESERELSDLLSVQYSVLRWLVILSIPLLVPFVFFATDFIATVYRPRYAAGGQALAVLAVGFAVHNVFSAQNNLMEALGHSRELAANSIVGAVLNVGLNLFLIPTYGITGAAIATVVSYLLMDALVMSELFVHTGEIVFSRELIEPLVVALPLLAGTSVVASWVPDTLLWIVGVSAAFSLAYIVMIVAIVGLSDDDVMIIRSAEERFGVRLRAVDYIVDRFS